jgi:EmrB/QacA subfamily drug resistance transporter
METTTATETGTRRWLALIVLCAATLMVILDGAIVTVALPSIQRSLGFSATGLEWVVNGYLIAFGGLLLLAGRLGDLLGGKRVFLAGLLLFVIASLACGLAASQPVLVAARFAQGAGGALASAVSLGMIVRLFPEPRDQARAMGVYSFTGAGGASLGLVLGGLLTQTLSWHWIFFVNVPVGAAVIAAGIPVLTPQPGIGLRAGADALGALLVTAGLMTGVYAIAETTRYGWLSAHTLVAAVIAIVLLAGFAVRQARARTPLLPLRVFRIRAVSVANGVQLLAVAAAFGFQVLIIQYLQHVLGYRPLSAGLALLPTAMTIAVLSVGVSARLNTRFGPQRMLVCGLVPIGVGLTLLLRLPPGPVADGYVAYVLPTSLLTGGFGLAFPAMITLAMSGAAAPVTAAPVNAASATVAPVTAAPSNAASGSAEDAGVTSGLVNTTQQVGAALGVAVLSTLAVSRTASALAAGAPVSAALTSGYHLAFGVGGCFVVAAIVVAVAGFGFTRRSPVRRAIGPEAADGNGAGEQQRGGDQHAGVHTGDERA